MPDQPAEPAPPLLVASELHKSYRLRRHPWDNRGHELTVINGLSLSVAPGEWVVLHGQSGCGKTTLLQVLGTLDRADRGSLHLFGDDVARLGPLGRARLRREGVGFVFQNFQLFPELTTLENVMLAGRVLGLPNHQSLDRARALLGQTGLSERERHFPAELSGGEQQRIAIARALMNRPRLILADEPTGNLDPETSADIMGILRDLSQGGDVSIVMVTHAHELGGYADRVLHLHEGRLFTDAPEA